MEESEAEAERLVVPIDDALLSSPFLQLGKRVNNRLVKNPITLDDDGHFTQVICNH